MAKFSKWLDWPSARRELQTGLLRLTLADNFTTDDFVWKDWTPTVTCDAGMTATITNLNQARYVTMRDFCNFYFDIWVTTAGASQLSMYVSVPLPSAYEHRFDTSVQDGGTPIDMHDVVFPWHELPGIPGMANIFRVQRTQDGSTKWGIGTNRRMIGWGQYEIYRG